MSSELMSREQRTLSAARQGDKERILAEERNRSVRYGSQPNRACVSITGTL